MPRSNSTRTADHSLPEVAPPTARRRWLMLAAVGIVGAVAVIGATALRPSTEDRSEEPATTDVVGPPASVGAVAPIELTSARTGAAGDVVAVLTERVERVPLDHVAWAQLGLAQVDAARIDGDLSRYDEARSAVQRSFDLQPTDNHLAHAAEASLFAALHDFGPAAEAAEAGLAINPQSPLLYGVLADALIQQGRFDESVAAVQAMLDLDPSGGALARAAYTHELAGDLDEAERLMTRALLEAHDDSTRAFAHVQLAELALGRGDNDLGLEHHLAALELEPTSVGALAGKAHALRELGQDQTSADAYQQLVDRAPLADFVVEYGDHLADMGRLADAQEQYERAVELTRAQLAAGFKVDAGIIMIEADHGDLSTALDWAVDLAAQHPFPEVLDAAAHAHELAGDVEAAADYRVTSAQFAQGGSGPR